MNYQIPTQPRPYFDWKEYRDCGLIIAGGLSIIVGGRNIGKTTGILIDILLNFANSENMVFFGRNGVKEIETYAKSFNAQYRGQFYMSKTEIWKMAPEIWINKKTKQEETRWKKTECIGLVGALGGIDGWRSANFDKVKYVIFDEYNQIGNPLNGERFITLWTSILRTKPDVYTIIIGNRDDATCDLNIELSIDVDVPEDFKGDWVQPIGDDPDFKDKLFYIDLDDTRFTNNNVKTAWKVVGNLMTTTGKYFKRGYKVYDNLDCYKLKPEQMAKVEWVWAFYYNETADRKLLYGRLGDLAVVHYDHHDEWQAPIRYAAGFKYHSKKKFIKPDWSFIYINFSDAMRNEQIVYTSVLAKEEAQSLFEDAINNTEGGSYEF